MNLHEVSEVPIRSRRDSDSVRNSNAAELPQRKALGRPERAFGGCTVWAGVAAFKHKRNFAGCHWGTFQLLILTPFFGVPGVAM